MSVGVVGGGGFSSTMVNGSCRFSVPVALVGNKTDLHQERAVSTEEGRKLAESWKAQFLETSAKQNEVCSIKIFFYSAIKRIPPSFSPSPIYSTCCCSKSSAIMEILAKRAVVPYLEQVPLQLLLRQATNRRETKVY